MIWLLFAYIVPYFVEFTICLNKARVKINDQRLTEFESKLPTPRRSFAEIGRSVKVDPATRLLFVEGREVVISVNEVVYYRTGHAPIK